MTTRIFQPITKRVVICGSMRVFPDMVRHQETLRLSGIPAIVPDVDGQALKSLRGRAFERFKRNLSFAYLQKIRQPSTFAVLAINLDRDRVPNYLGPNTFAEIAVAFAQSKRIYLLQDIPDAYKDELLAWNAIVLGGDLQRLIRDVESECVRASLQFSLL